MNNSSVAASSPHRASSLHTQPGILWDLECCIPKSNLTGGKKSSLSLNDCKVFQGVSSLQSLQGSAGETDPVLVKADGSDDPSRSLGALFRMDARVHQPQGHL